MHPGYPHHAQVAESPNVLDGDCENASTHIHSQDIPQYQGPVPQTVSRHPASTVDWTSDTMTLSDENITTTQAQATRPEQHNFSDGFITHENITADDLDVCFPHHPFGISDVAGGFE